MTGCDGRGLGIFPLASASVMEHKDERLHVAEGVDWRDKLAKLRRELSDDDPTAADAQDRDGEDGDD